MWSLVCPKPVIVGDTVLSYQQDEMDNGPVLTQVWATRWHFKAV